MSRRTINSGSDRTTWVIIAAIAAFTLIVIVAIVKFGPAAPAKEAAGEGSAGSLVNKPLPNITLNDVNGKPVSFGSLRGKNIVLFFNEGLMCYPGCWNQMASFGSDARFNSAGVAALSIVIDSSDDWQKAIEKMPELAPATVLFDSGARVSRQLGMLAVNSSMHRGMYPGHSYLIVDKKGVVRDFYDDPNMGLNNDLLWEKIQSLNN